MDDPKIITAHVYSPDKSIFKSSKNDKARCTWTTCNNSENCGLHARGECSYVSTFGWQRCPYGKCHSETGFTRRARKYRIWIQERKERFADVLDKLKSHSGVMAVVGDYIFLPYDRIARNEAIPFLAKDGLFHNGSSFLKRESFTIDAVMSICSFRPQALLGGEITSYQKEVVPKFILHLSENMPDMYEKLCAVYPRAAEIISEHSNVGREAILETLNPNIGVFEDIHGGKWRWDGEYLTSEDSHASFMLVNRFTELRIKPAPKQWVKITDDAQVTENTEFKV